MTEVFKRYPSRGEIPDDQVEVIVNDKMFGLDKGKRVGDEWFTFNVIDDSWEPVEWGGVPDWWIPMPVDEPRVVT